MGRPLRFCLVLGTRPEAIKMAPLLRELQVRGHQVQLVATGQHPDMAAAMLAEVGLAADADLGIHRQGNSPADLLAAILARLPGLLQAMKPSMLLVQGDTVSTLGGALAAAYARVPLAHMEAGLRTGDREAPFPEESHRCLVGALADLHFAPTPRAQAALLAEGVDPARVHITGNTGIDALLAMAERVGQGSAAQHMLAARYAALLDSPRPLLLATVHRRENLHQRDAIADAFRRLVIEGHAGLVMPLHPNPAVREHFRARLEGLPHVHLLPPVDHADMVWLMQRCRLLLTDSGGLQEEAPALGLRTLILRDRTERPEAVECGAARLVGTATDAIVSAAIAALAEPTMPRLFPFGDGQAAVRMANRMEEWLASPTPARQLQAA